MPLTRARLRISDYNKSRKKRTSDTEKNIQAASLPLTSMVDMFTTLVVYLIFCSADLKDWVAISSDIDLPKAKANWATPEKGASLQISKDMVIGDQDKPLISVAKLDAAPFSVPEIKEYLKGQPNKDGYVNVVGDRHVSFGHIRKVIASAQDAGFKNVNLAVSPK